MPLVTPAEVSSFLVGQGITSVFDEAEISARINAADALLGQELGITYGTAAASRTFDGSGSGDLIIDACQDITAVVEVDYDGSSVVNTYSATSDYRAHPYNANPKRMLRLHSARWPRGRGNIKVTASFGSGTGPADVKEAELYLSALAVLAGANLQTVDGALAGAIKSYSTGVYEVVYHDPSSGKQNFTATATGWKEFIERVIAARQDRADSVI